MSWYLQYRPQRFADLHVASVREQLLKILETGKFSHAYLFAGPKGTGKTSSARILARVLNEPKNQAVIAAGKGKLVEPESDDAVLAKIATGQSQVVVEQDAASHRGIDDIRSLHEVISVVPNEGFARVVILDEVHMLTNEAFNALLKLLEEPPKHVVLVLATTELHKVPATIQSRCQVVRFRRATREEIGSALQVIAKSEKITLSQEHADRLATAANGSFRDAVKLFEQVAQGGEVDEALLNIVAGNAQRLESLIKALDARDARQVSAVFRDFREEGVSLSAVEQALMGAYHARLHAEIQAKKSGEASGQKTLELLEFLTNRLGGYESMEGLRLELACVAWCLPESESKGEKSGSGENSPEKKPMLPTKREATPPPKVVKASEVSETAKEPIAKPLSDDRVATESPLQPSVEASSLSLPFQELQARWSEILLACRMKSSALEALLRNTKLTESDGDALALSIALPFHKEQLEQPKYSRLLDEVLESQFGQRVPVQLILEARPSFEDRQVAPQSANDVDDQLAAAVESILLN